MDADSDGDEDAPPLKEGSIVIQGASGKRAPYINGVFEPSKETCFDMPVYNKLGSSPLCLELNKSSSSGRWRWNVKTIESRGAFKNAAYGYCESDTACFPHEIDRIFRTHDPFTNTFYDDPAVSISPVHSGPITIQGASMAFADVVNGSYIRTEETCSGMPVYQKINNPDIYLELGKSKVGLWRWGVKNACDRGRLKNKVYGYCESIFKVLPLNIDSAWRSYDKQASKFLPDMSVSITASLVDKQQSITTSEIETHKQHEIFLWLQNDVFKEPKKSDAELLAILYGFFEVNVSSFDELVDAVNRKTLDRPPLSPQVYETIMEHLKLVPLPHDIHKYYCRQKEIDISRQGPSIPGILFGSFEDNNGERVSVVLKLNKAAKQQAMSPRDLARESNILKRLGEEQQRKNCQFVVDMLDYNLALSIEYLVLRNHGATLETYMLDDNFDTRCVLARKICKAVAHVHEAGIMHGDLKPANILVFMKTGGALYVRLADFDSARVVGASGPDGLYPLNKYSKGWACREVRSDKAVPASFAIDLFPLGLILAVILRRVCNKSLTILPTDSEPSKLLNDQDCLYEALQCERVYHEKLVRRFCSLKPEERGNIEDAVTFFNDHSIHDLKLMPSRKKVDDKESLSMMKEINKISQMVSNIDKKQDKIFSSLTKEFSVMVESPNEDTQKLLHKIAHDMSKMQADMVTTKKSSSAFVSDLQLCIAQSVNEAVLVAREENRESIRQLAESMNDGFSQLDQAVGTCIDKEDQLAKKLLPEIAKLLENVESARNEIDKLRKEVQAMHKDLIREIHGTTSAVKSYLDTDFTKFLLSQQEEQKMRQDFMLKGLQDAVREETEKVQDLLTSQKPGMSTLDLECLSSDLTTVLRECLESRDGAAEGSGKQVLTAIEGMQKALNAVVESKHSSDKDEICSLLRTYQGQLSELQTTTDSLAVNVGVLRKNQQEIAVSTRNVLRENGRACEASVIQAMKELGAELAKSKIESSSQFSDQLAKLEEKFHDQLNNSGYIKNLRHIIDKLEVTSQNESNKNEAFQAQALQLLRSVGDQVSHVASEVEIVQNKLDSLPDRISSSTGVLMAAHSTVLLDKMESMFSKLSASFMEEVKGASADLLLLHVHDIENNLKEWLAATISEAQGQSNDAVLDVIRTQHKYTAEKLQKLQEMKAACCSGDLVKIEQTSEMFRETLSSIQGTLSEVLKKVETCEDNCADIKAGIASLITHEEMHDQTSCAHAEKVLHELQTFTKNTLETLKLQGISPEKSQQALKSMKNNFTKEMTKYKDAKSDNMKKMKLALSDMYEEHETNSDDFQACNAATQRKLDVILESLEESRAEVRALRVISEAQKQLLDKVEQRGNVLPTKYVVFPEIKKKLEPGKILSRTKSRAYGVLWQKFRLFFVCDVSNKFAEYCGPEQKGYKIEVPTKTMKRLMPILVGSMAVLRVVVQLHGIPAGMLPQLPLSDLRCPNEVMKTLMQNVPQDDIAEWAHDGVDQAVKKLKEDGEQAASVVMEGRVDELFNLIKKEEKFADKPLDGWVPRHAYLKRTDTLKGGGSKWVHPEFEAMYKEHGDTGNYN